MKQYLGFTKRFSLLFTPLVASSVLFTSPSQAATFAFSDGELSFTNFSGSISTEFNSDNNGETKAITLDNDDFVDFQNNPVVETSDSPANAFTDVVSSVSGDGRNYIGLVKSESEIVGNFDIGAGQTFSFNFSSFLDLGTEIDTSPAENAQANGEISFYLFDTSNISEQALPDFLDNLLDNPSSINTSAFSFFSLDGNVNTLGDDSITSQNSQDITLTDNFTFVSSGGNQELVTASFAGSFQRYFDNSANITLIATRRSEARVTAPEPSTSLALLLFLALLALVNKGRLRANISAHSLRVKVIKLTVQD
ncbi:hypothetical protein [Mastigocladopsis repens]|uniref:hypothetical protein n=1 Tax=Mastigocladopsis repens TaxID=221287 RepID=UPI0002E3CA0F|nr:hypothetical protein [Mastigocladopsis repens]